MPNSKDRRLFLVGEQVGEASFMDMSQYMMKSLEHPTEVIGHNRQHLRHFPVSELTSH